MKNICKRKLSGTIFVVHTRTEMVSRVFPGTIVAQRRILTLSLVVHELKCIAPSRIMAIAHFPSKELHTGASKDEEDE